VPSRQPPTGAGRYSWDVTSPEQPSSVRPVAYKGEPLDAGRGPGLGCFRFQVGLLVLFIVLTPLTVVWNWPVEVSAGLLFATLILLLLTGQTVIFLLRLVAAAPTGPAEAPTGPAEAPTEPAEPPTDGPAEPPARDPWRTYADAPVDPAAEPEHADTQPGDPGMRE